MNPSITRANTWKAVKRHYFIAVASACFTLLGIVAGSAFNLGSVGGGAKTGATGPESVADVRKPVGSESQAVQPRLIVIFLVESRERANDVMAAVRHERAKTSQVMFFAFKATTPEEEASVTALVDTWEGKDVSGIAETWQATDVL